MKNLSFIYQGIATKKYAHALTFLICSAGFCNIALGQSFCTAELDALVQAENNFMKRNSSPPIAESTFRNDFRRGVLSFRTKPKSETEEQLRVLKEELRQILSNRDGTNLYGYEGKVAFRRAWICSLEWVLDPKSSNSSAVTPSQNQPQQTTLQNQATQQQSQQAQQTQQLAAQNQARADQARQGKRRRHEPENEASHCIQPDFGGLYGGMKNTCNFKVWYTYCGYRPKENSWLTGMSCEKQSFGSDSVGPGRTSASHTKGVESIHWIACKEPAWTVDTEFVPGQGIKGRCYTVGGN